MYDSTAITALTGRIGWAQPVQPTSKVLSSENEGSTGRLFSSFHAMVTVENVEECMPISNAVTASNGITNTTLNAKLKEISDQAILKVLNRCFDVNDAANFRFNSGGCYVDLSGADYTGKIVARPTSFDNAVGYQVAYDVLEMMLTTSRSNLRERAAKDGISLYTQQQGARDETGALLVDGVFQKLESAYAKINSVFFPQACKGPVIRDKSYLW